MGDGVRDGRASGGTGGLSPGQYRSIDLRSLLAWRLPPEGWDLLDVLLDSATVEGRRADQATIDLLWRELTSIQEARRLGDDQGSEPPRRVRERLGVPVVIRIPEGRDVRSDGDGAPALRPEPDEFRRVLPRSARQLLGRFTFDRGTISFADTDEPGDHQDQTEEFDVGGIPVVVRTVGRRAVSVAAATQTAGPGQVLELRIGADSDPERYFLPVHVDQPGGPWTASLEVPADGAVLEYALIGPFPAEALTEADGDAVRASVRAATKAAKDAWYLIAQARPVGDPIRNVVRDGLR
ncbi:hypothetical protein ACG83_29850 [Frankia sp. R43]|uniref:hypothetical protein n=1 Tax=Frankia sp. R43 TaxID=269536 RepID=UPI0006CA26D5|nr:hypothetical protein [Frankia sp. R43]KPM52528.1 hypothetical protein ACG83_29850 [Frankia sp. R43]